MKKIDVPICLILSLLWLIIFSLTDYIQWYGDAYLYRFDFSTGEPISSFGEILPSQYAHYFMMNGRVWAHVLCQGFSALWGQRMFAICNATMYVMFGLLFAKVVDGSWRQVSVLLSSILIILFFSDTSYIPNCQIGYIWTSTMVMAFIIIFFRARINPIDNWGYLILIFFLSFFAGNGNEAIAIGVGASLIYELITSFKKFTITQWIMLLGFGMGGMLLCLSPGSLDRSMGDSANFLYSAYRLILHSRALYLLIFTVVLLKLRHKLCLKSFFSDNQFFFVALISLILFNFIIGIGRSGRQLFGVELFSAILTIRALKNHAFPQWALTTMGILIAVIYYLKFEYLRDSNEDLRTLKNEMEASSEGVIFIDFKKYNQFVRPTEVRNMQNMSPEMLFFISSIQDDMNNKGLYYQSVRKGIDPPPYSVVFRIYPTSLEDVLKQTDRNYVMRCVDGTFLIVQDRKCPAIFILHRTFNIPGFKIPIHPYNIEFNEKSFLNLDSINVLLENFEVPLVENLGIEVLRNKISE